MTYVATVRQRGQFTLPDKIRKELPWLSEGSAIHIWKKIWQMIKLTRSFKSKRDDIPASQFVIKDRQQH